MFLAKDKSRSRSHAFTQNSRNVYTLDFWLFWDGNFHTPLFNFGQDNGVEISEKNGLNMSCRTGMLVLYAIGIDNTLPLAGKWVHIAAVLGSNADDRKIYVDGVFYKSTIGKSNGQTIASPMYVGRYYNSTSYNYGGGCIKAYRLWNRKLTPAEIIQSSQTDDISTLSFRSDNLINEDPFSLVEDLSRQYSFVAAYPYTYNAINADSLSNNFNGSSYYWDDGSRAFEGFIYQWDAPCEITSISVKAHNSYPITGGKIYVGNELVFDKSMGSNRHTITGNWIGQTVTFLRDGTYGMRDMAMNEFNVRGRVTKEMPDKAITRLPAIHTWANSMGNTEYIPIDNTLYFVLAGSTANYGYESVSVIGYRDIYNTSSVANDFYLANSEDGILGIRKAYNPYDGYIYFLSGGKLMKVYLDIEGKALRDTTDVGLDLKPLMNVYGDDELSIAFNKEVNDGYLYLMCVSGFGSSYAGNLSFEWIEFRDSEGNVGHRIDFSDPASKNLVSTNGYSYHHCLDYGQLLCAPRTSSNYYLDIKIPNDLDKNKYKTIWFKGRSSLTQKTKLNFVSSSGAVNSVFTIDFPPYGKSDIEGFYIGNLSTYGDRIRLTQDGYNNAFIADSDIWRIPLTAPHKIEHVLSIYSGATQRLPNTFGVTEDYIVINGRYHDYFQIINRETGIPVFADKRDGSSYSSLGLNAYVYKYGGELYALTHSHPNGDRVKLSSSFSLIVHELTTPVARQDVIFRGTLDTTLGSEAQYSVLVNGEQVYHLSSSNPMPLDINLIIPNDRFTQGSNTLTIHVVIDREITKDFGYTVVKTNTLPSISLSSSPATAHKGTVNVMGEVDDKDLDDVSYRILFNGEQVHPSSGFTSLQTPPFNFTFPLSSSQFNMGDNTVTVELKDSAGGVSSKDLVIPKINNLPTIQDFVIQGLTATGNITDEDGDMIRYNIYVNGERVFPEDGYTTYLNSPHHLMFDIPDTAINAGSTNKITVNIEDDFGGVYTESIEQILDYAGLMFTDTEGKYYSTNAGVILKYLDTGLTTAGETSQVFTVYLKNTTGYLMENIRIWVNQLELDPVDEKVEISLSDNPFDPHDYLSVPISLRYGERVPFYVRINSTKLASGGGLFEIRASADPAPDFTEPEVVQ